MTDESMIPGFSGNYDKPMGKIRGIPFADKKHSGVLIKRMMSLRPKPRSRTGSKAKGIEADSKIHFKHNVKFW